MAYKQSKHLFQGMNRDLSDDKQKGIFYIDAHNIRITAREDTTLLSVTNEKGNKALHNQENYGSYVGHAVLNNYLVLFTILNDKSYIWRLTIDNSTVTEATVLYSGNLGFDSKHTIETLVDYETEEIQKVYWTDGINQPRMINIVSNNIRDNVDTQFDFVPEVFTGVDDNLEVKVDKLLDNEGIFAAGTIQYFISYYSKFGQETNIVWQSPLLYISPKDRGGNVSETIANSFRLTIKNPSSNFDYIRVYSIQHTGQDTDLIGKKVIDLKVPSATNEVVYIDRGIEGESVNPVDLFYKGGIPTAIGTMSAKDQVLFLGNITLNNNQKVSDEIKEAVKNIPIIYRREPAYELDDPSGKLYSYENQLNETKQSTLVDYYSSLIEVNHTIKSFKYLETYRFGLQFQDKWGRWTEPCWIEDVQNDKSPLIYKFESDGELKPYVYLPIAGLTGSFDNDLLDMLEAEGYVKVRPLVVLPNEAERECVAQGVLCPTVYNLGDRKTNSPYAQPSWFFRPYEGTYKCEDSGSHNSNDSKGMALPYLHNSVIQGKISRFSEIEKAPEVQVPPCKRAYYNGEPIDNQDNNFFIDQSILTLNSPDIDFNNYVIDTSNYGFRIVGAIDVTGFAGSLILQTSTAPNDFYKTTDFGHIAASGRVGYGRPQIQNKAEGYLSTYIQQTNISGEGWCIMGAGGYWYDTPYTLWFNTDYEGGSSKSAYVYPSAFRYHFKVFPWQAAGSLNNTSDLSEINLDDYFDNTVTAGEYSIPRNTANLQKKILANLRYSSYTQYIGSLDYDVTDVEILNTDISDTVNITTPQGRKIYYTNIDKLLEAPINTLNTMISNLPSGLYTDYTDLIDNDVFKQKYDWDIFITDNDAFNTDAGISTETNSNSIGHVLRRNMCYGFNGSNNQVAKYDTESDDYGWTDLYGGAMVQGGPGETALKINSKLSTKCTATSITYRSGKHAVIALDNEGDHYSILPRIKHYFNGNEVRIVGELPNPDNKYIYGVGGYNESTGYYNPNPNHQGNRAPLSKYVWEDVVRTPVQKTINLYSTSDFNLSDKGVILLGEIYRKEILNKFGGNTDDALEHNVWIPAGESITLSTLRDNFYELKWKEGDTYFQRYDCLKTYPYSNESMNNIVEILSFMCETRVNVAGRYDKNRGLIDNTFITNENFNLINKAYTQDDNFFSYKITDDRFKLNKFKTQITWTKVKSAGALIDNWTNLTLQNTLDLDGDKGELVSLNRYNNDVIAFQPKGISQIKFNSNVQVATNTGEPIELANSGRVEGKRYLFENIGCQNKWSICEDEFGVIFFIDNYSKSIFRLSNEGIVSLTDSKGFREWMEKVNTTDSWVPYKYNEEYRTSQAFRTFYDKTFKDVYFVNDRECLVYSEALGQFISFMSYNFTNAMFNIGDGFYAIERSIYKQFAGDYNNIYGKIKDYDITFIDNQIPEMNKIFTNLEYRSDTYVEDTLKHDETFNTIRVWNEYQDSGEVDINTLLDRPYISDLQKKFRVWRIQLPRDRSNILNRINNTWARIKLKKSVVAKNEKTVLHDALVGYYI